MHVKQFGSFWRIMAIGLLLLLFAAAQGPSAAVNAASTDPIAHDPTMIKEGQYYYVIITGDSGVPNTYLPVKRSTDLIHWEELGPVFSDPPQWVVDTLGITPADFWAPDINYFNGKYHLYYAASQFGVNNSVIGLVTNETLDPDSPDYEWVDEGLVLRSQPGDNFNAIDPDVIFDENDVPWLSSGSFWVGIQMRQLDAATGKLSTTDTTIHSLVDRFWAPNAVEGPSIVSYGGNYYLFASFDYCCRGVDSDYRVVVGRAEEVTGTYHDKNDLPLNFGGGTEVLRGYNEFAGPGGGDVYVDGSNVWFVHHYYDRDDNGAPKLSVRQITWSGGWPTLGDPLSGSREVGHGNAYFKLFEKSSGKVVATPPDGPQAPLCGYEGANIELATNLDTACQQWRIDYSGDGYYSFLNQHSNKVSDVAFCGYFDGANIGQWGWLNNDCQKFRFIPTTDGWTQIQNKNEPGGSPGKLVEANLPCGPEDGANIQLWGPDADRCQQFRVEPVDDVLIVNAGSGKVLDVAGCGKADGFNVVQTSRRDSDCQLWRFTHTDNGYYKIVNRKSDKEIVVADRRCKGSNLVLSRGAPKKGAPADETCQQWRLEPLNDGTFKLVSRHNDQVIEVSNCTAPKSNVKRGDWEDTACQRFKIVVP